MSIFQIDFNDIERLNPGQLTELLKTLLYLEARKNNLLNAEVTVSLKLSVKDGGEDGRIEWTDGPDFVRWLPARLSMFQCKAEGSMTKLEFTNASLVNPVKAQKKNSGAMAHKTKSESKSKPSKMDMPQSLGELKPQVKQVLDQQGAYTFFYSKPLTKQQIDERLEGIRDSLRICKRADAETALINLYDANKIADWANEHFVAVALVCSWSGKDIPFAVQTWQSWSQYEEHTLFEYIKNSAVEGNIEALRVQLSMPRKVARILGNPGLGKSRLAIQALSESEQLRTSVVYIDAAMVQADIIGAVRQFRNRGDAAVIVVDNCELHLHQLLRNEVMHPKSNLSLLTIDFDPGENTGTQGSDVLIFATPMDSIEIQQLLAPVFRHELSDNELKRIVEFAQGYPGMAALIARDRIDGKPHAGTLSDDVLVDRLLWGRRPVNDNAFAAISACSLFSRVGFEEERAEERTFVAENCSQISRAEFYGHIKDFMQRRIVQQRGDFVIVVPAPLAACLAAKWWSRCSDERALELITGELPAGLGPALCEQIKMLHYLPRVQEITKSLCGDQAPFGRAEVLNTERGSLLFRAFTEVSPEDCTNALDQAFDGWSRSDLLLLGPGRRNLVWALERLCFWTNTFEAAAQILLRFAEAENETWGNNATGQFVQLFQLYLPGTQASLGARAKILKEAVQFGSGFTRVIALKACERAFHIDHFTRMGGVERQGARPVAEDYSPRTGHEIVEYWTSCMHILVQISKDDESLGEAVRAEFERIIYPSVVKHFLEPLRDAIREITNGMPHSWHTAAQAFEFALKNNETEFSPKEQEVIAEISQVLGPKSLEDRIRMWIVDSSWDNVRVDSKGEIFDDSVSEVKAIAHQTLKQWNEFKGLVPLLLQGQQTNSFALGKMISELPCEIFELIDECKRFLISKPDGSANASFLTGILAGKSINDRALVTAVLDEFAVNPSLRNYVVSLTTSITPDERDLERCSKLLYDPTVHVESFVRLSYGGMLDQIPINAITKLSEQIATHSSQGKWTALKLLSQFSYRSDERFDKCRSAFKTIMLMLDLSKDQDGYDRVMAGHRWQETAVKLLTAHDEPELAKHIIAQIVAACGSEEGNLYSKFDRAFKNVLNILLAVPYITVIWEDFSDALTSENWVLRTHMEWVVGNIIKQEGDKPGPLFLMPDDFLFEWSKTNSKAAQILAKAAPVILERPDVKDGIEISPLVRRLIDEHGADEIFLSHLTANIGSFGGWGSNTPRYKARVSLFKQLTTHKIPAVRSWAKRNLKSSKLELRNSEKRDEEWDAGIHERF